MTENRKPRHRGPHPRDAALFAPEYHPALQAAVTDLSWLLTRSYANKSALKLVGDRYQLTARQRQAVARCACADQSLARRRRHEIPASKLRGLTLLIDGFNVLTTIETALSGGCVFKARDGCCRDIAGIHGNYRLLTETQPAVELIFQTLEPLRPKTAIWYFDQPVSNSGRLKTLILSVAENHHPLPTTEVHLVPNPDPILRTAPPAHIIATADSPVLDKCDAWFNLASHLIHHHLPKTPVVILSEPASEGPL